jgi:histidine triad (HIT) family protein
VYQDDDLLAIRDIAPAAPTHILIIPRRHIESLDSLSDADTALIGRLMLAAARIARDLNIAGSGYRVVANTNRHGGQSVWHLHLHLLGGRQMSWPPG